MRRGFKTKAEQMSVEWRKRCGVGADDALPARRLAEELKVKLLCIRDIPELEGEHVNWLLRGDDGAWSGFTMEIGAVNYVVHNTAHASPRQESDIMHELAHILCEHPPGEVLWVGPFCLKHFNPDEEEEAAWLGGTLQVPRVALLKLCRRRVAPALIAEHFRASERMVRYRIQMCGIERQIERAR